MKKEIAMGFAYLTNVPPDEAKKEYLRNLRDKGFNAVPTVEGSLLLGPSEQELVRELGKPDWLFFAGNCSRVQELADSAVAEAERIGKEART